VFLYFLQKKGWFGVERNAGWGTGPKDFLRRLFEKQITNYDNFFNDILEPLFYEALAQPRDYNFYSRFNCKIPFLNGGLFDPINNYDWVHTDITLPNELFSNQIITKEGDKGAGILDIFDRYNFTVKEDEPLEKEVAVDPEMLGKVFENLLEANDRKTQGTFYTPREIVHYMCQESLVSYLTAGLEENISKNDISKFIKVGELVGEHEATVISKEKETKDYSYKLPESIRNHAKQIDEKLASVKVCDPACGSGAFLVGMMSEIVKARNVLSIFIEENDRTLYDFKRYAIEN
ncbi:MAG: Eco57I restriction-modification methylase domain-containing protein, partial [bacterium]